MSQTLTQPESLLGWMSSLSDPTRLRLLRVLDEQELTVADLCAILQVPQSTVSRHLRLLAEQRWVSSRRSGQSVAYRMILDEIEPAARELWFVARGQIESWNTTEQDRIRLAARLKHRDESKDDFFARSAADWEAMREQLYGNRFTWQALAALIDRDAVVADLACGTGTVSVELAHNVRYVLAVDASPQMLSVAEHRLENFTNAEVRRGDLTELPIQSASCDKALLVLGLAYVREPAVALAEARRILKVGGELVVIDLLPHDRDDFRVELKHVHRGFNKADLQAMLQQARFANVRVRGLVPEEQARGPALVLASGVAKAQ